MLILGHMRQLVQACHPASHEEAVELWHRITPVKFGLRLLWVNGAGNFQTLASYRVPEDTGFLVILKTECYTFTDTAAAPGFRAFEPPPTGTARWVVDPGIGQPQPITETVPIHLLVDCSELLIVKAGLSANLQILIGAPPDANNRFIRSTVYAYQVDADIADRIGTAEVLTIGADA